MILIAIGANLPGVEGGSARMTCERAAARLREMPDLLHVALSPWYRTVPIPKSGQPDYCNGVIRLEGDPRPADLLAELQEIELDFGRMRAEPNAPRTLDLDIIDLNGAIRAVPDPVLPHPRAHLRAFVLRPILDVAPAWRHPTLRIGVATLLAGLPEQGVRPWDSGEGDEA
jgi:2-amino-4-hydroxy-6-hydroxymethyldihydropteridine diphosphokinase